MAKVKVYNLEGRETGTEELNPKIFDVEVKESLIYDAVMAQEASARQVLAHTKTKAEVRGGGKKPWRQKGTGSARHGSRRSPIWVGGGITFGPRKDRNFSKKINKQAKKKALFMALSDKVKSNALVLLEKLELPEIKTKNLFNIKKVLPVGKTVLFVLPAADEKIIKSARNLANTSTISADSLNIVDVLSYSSLVLPKEAIKKIEETFLKK